LFVVPLSVETTIVVHCTCAAERKVMSLCPGNDKRQQLFAQVDMMVRIHMGRWLAEQVAAPSILALQLFFNDRKVKQIDKRTMLICHREMEADTKFRVLFCQGRSFRGERGINHETGAE